MAQGQLPGVLGWWLGWWQSRPAQLWAWGQGTAPAKSPVGSAREVISGDRESKEPAGAARLLHKPWWAGEGPGAPPGCPTPGQAHLGLGREEGNVDLCQGFDDLGSPGFHQLVEEGVRTGCKGRRSRRGCSASFHPSSLPHSSAGTISVTVPPLWVLTVSEEDMGSSVLGGGGILEVVDEGVDGLEERKSSWAGQDGTVGIPPVSALHLHPIITLLAPSLQPGSFPRPQLPISAPHPGLVSLCPTLPSPSQRG